MIELADDLDIETVTEIFIRVNSAGTELSQADFAMSKIAVNETYGGNLLRKAIDYFCHLAVSPEFLSTIEKNDKTFAASEFLPQIRWLKDTNDDIYDPTYNDMLRVAFTSEFRRGKLQVSHVTQFPGGPVTELASTGVMEFPGSCEAAGAGPQRPDGAEAVDADPAVVHADLAVG